MWSSTEESSRDMRSISSSLEPQPGEARDVEDLVAVDHGQMLSDRGVAVAVDKEKAPRIACEGPSKRLVGQAPVVRRA